MNNKIKYKYIVIEGVIGVGKTSLCRLLANKYNNSETLFEEFEENPFLKKFYNDRKNYAFQTQLFFLLDRFKQQKEFKKKFDNNLFENKIIFSDYFFAKDSIFAEINLEEEELALYYNIFNILKPQLIQPDLIIYLKASTDTLMKRIMKRDRTYERNMEKSYIEQLNNAYNNFFDKYEGNKLIIETDNIDFINNDEDFNNILNIISER